jgi:acyl phosphate:glycerol-3-phosphate acyltransferase
MEFVFIIIGYLIGSIPFGLVLSKMAGYGDIRSIGSGNIGATNVLRTGNKKLALATLLLDGGKGAIAVLIAKQLGGDNEALLAGLFSVIGHMFPIWLKFKGGKGVATTIGMILALAPLAGVTTSVVWLFMAFGFRYSSLSALVAVLSSPLAAYLIYDDTALSALCGLITLLIWFKHRANIRRLIEGKEPKIGKKREEENDTARNET